MIRLSIPDMSCGHCVHAVTEAVRQVDPEAKLEIDLGTKVATIDTSSAEGAVAKAIEQAGYSNSSAPAPDPQGVPDR